jgi:large subunit ribosomal protein L32
MAAVPKTRGSKARRDRRRSQIKIQAKSNIEKDPKGGYKLSHHANLTTGMYKGKKIMKAKI